MAWVLALDFGGTKLSAGVVDTAVLDPQQPQWHALARARSAAGGSRQADMAQMMALARQVLDGRSPQAVGISFGGPVAFRRGVVRLSHHVPGWEETPLAAQIAAAYGLPPAAVAVDNDANVAALGEHRFGAGRGLADMMYITVSTGVGGGWILGERPYRGADGMAGEIGHTVVDPAGPLCLCGKQGCVERLASGPYMAADLAAARGREAGAFTGMDVARLAAADDADAAAILRRGAWALGTAIGSAANLVNPQHFILGGGVTKSGAMWWAQVRDTARAVALPEVGVTVTAAALGDDAPLWGAVALVWA